MMAAMQKVCTATQWMQACAVRILLRLCQERSFQSRGFRNKVLTDPLRLLCSVSSSRRHGTYYFMLACRIARECMREECEEKFTGQRRRRTKVKGGDRLLAAKIPDN